MADVAYRSWPVPTEPAEFAGVTIALAPPVARWSLRARDARQLGALLGLEVPTKIGQTTGGMSCLGPDEWLLRLPAGMQIPTGEGLPVGITDISERAIGLVVKGDAAISLLSSGCPLDLSEYNVGYATRTVYEGTEILIVREADSRFLVEVWRSFAPWLWAALITAAAHV